MSIDLELNYASENQTYFYQKCGCSNEKNNETQNLKIWDKTKIKLLKAAAKEVVGPKLFHIKDSILMTLAQVILDFHFVLLTFVLATGFQKINALKVSKVILFFI